MLSIQYPRRYRSIFEEFNDFDTIDASMCGRGATIHLNKPVLVDFSKRKELEGILGVGGCITPSTVANLFGVILPAFGDPARHLLNQDRLKLPNALNFSLWVGDRSHLRLLKEVTDVVALHCKSEASGGPAIGHRTSTIPPEEAHSYHAYGFCNLDELRRFPYRSMHTSVPITAAIAGIDLRTRDRRPKGLVSFSHDIRLTESQLELAYENCKAIREAMNYARCNYSTHTQGRSV